MSKTGYRGSRLRRAEHETPIEKIFTSNRYLSLDDQEEIDVYARYLTYRVQRDYTSCAKRKMADCLTIGHGMILS